MGPHICIFPNQSLRSWLWKMQIYGPTFYRSLAQEEIVILSQENESESKKRERKAEVILGCLLFCRSALHATCIHYSTTPSSPWRPSFDKSQSERGRIASCFDPYPICTRNRLGSAGKSSSTVVIHIHTQMAFTSIRRLTMVSGHGR